MVKNLAANAEGIRDNPWVGKIPRRREKHLTTVFSPGESHGLRATLQGCKESDRTKAT